MTDAALTDPHVVDYYTRHGDAEYDRLASRSGRLKLLRVQEIVRAHLPAGQLRIADVGGGPGAHAAWLAADGHHVQLFDPVAALVDRARQRAATGPAFAAEIADARALPLADSSVDAVVMLGPLYHLTEPADRARALAEAVRVTRPGGLVVADMIPRHAILLDVMRRMPLSQDAARYLSDGPLRTGRHDPAFGFTHAFSHTPEQFSGELTAAGLADVTLRGVEGPGWLLLGAEPPSEVDPLFENALRVARMLEAEPSMLAANAYLLGLGRVSPLV